MIQCRRRSIKHTEQIINLCHFVLLIDYGLETFRKTSECNDEAIEKNHNVYLAPELRKGLTKPTEQSDVYSFSVILIEISTRGDPYQVCVKYMMLYRNINVTS